MDIRPSFSVTFIKKKGNNFCDVKFVALQSGSALERKEFATGRLYF